MLAREAEIDHIHLEFQVICAGYMNQQRRTEICSRPEKKTPVFMARQKRGKPLIRGRLESGLQAAATRMNHILSLVWTDRRAVTGP